MPEARLTASDEHLPSLLTGNSAEPISSKSYFDTIRAIDEDHQQFTTRLGGPGVSLSSSAIFTVDSVMLGPEPQRSPALSYVTSDGSMFGSRYLEEDIN
jgi:hypothetical protein